MGIFHHMAKRSIEIDGEGKKIFFLPGFLPWSKALLIEDDAQEERIHRKLTWVAAEGCISAALAAAVASQTMQSGSYVPILPLLVFVAIAILWERWLFRYERQTMKPVTLSRDALLSHLAATRSPTLILSVVFCFAISVAMGLLCFVAVPSHWPAGIFLVLMGSIAGIFWLRVYLRQSRIARELEWPDARLCEDFPPSGEA